MKRRAAAAIAVPAVLLSACVTSGTSSLPSAARLNLSRLPQRGGPPSDRKAPARLYVSDPIANAVIVYRIAGHNRQPMATITNGIDGPSGMATDAAGDVYVANTLNNTVTEYRWNGTVPVKTYSQDFFGPVDVAVDGNGTLYVANFYSFDDSVVEIPAGSTSPSLAIRNPGSAYPVGLTLDAQDNLYVAYQTFYSLPEIYVYAPGSNSGVERLKFPLPRSIAAGVLLDNDGNLLVADGTLPGVEVFPPGRDDPSKVLSKRGSPQFLQFAPEEREIFVSDTAHRKVEEYTYPGGHLIGTISSGLKSVYGLAVDAP